MRGLIFTPKSHVQDVVKSALMAFLGQARGVESTHEEYFIYIIHNSFMRVDLKVRIQRCQLPSTNQLTLNSSFAGTSPALGCHAHTRAVSDVSLQSCKRDKRLIDLNVDFACLSNVSDDFVYILSESVSKSLFSQRIWKRNSKSFQRERQRIY